MESQENEAKKCIKIRKILKQSLLLTVAVFFLFYFHSHSHSIHSDKVHLRFSSVLPLSLSLLPFLFDILKVFVEFIWFPFWLYLPIVESTLTFLTWAAAKTERERGKGTQQDNDDAGRARWGPFNKNAWRKCPCNMLHRYSWLSLIPLCLLFAGFSTTSHAPKRAVGREAREFKMKRNTQLPLSAHKTRSSDRRRSWV